MSAPDFPTTFSVVNPVNSFVQFGKLTDNPTTEGCEGELQDCLPVAGLADLQFMVKLKFTGPDRENVLSYDFAASIDHTGSIEDEFDYTGLTIVDTGSEVDVSIYFKWNGSQTEFDNLPVNTCFQIFMYYFPSDSSAGPVKFGQTLNCFYKTVDTCYTSLVEYNNNDDAFGFEYTEAPSGEKPFYNKVRLPFYLHSPVFPEEQTTYQKSDGSSQKLSHRIWTDYKLKTDWWFKEWIKKFVVATAHDNVFITNGLSNLTHVAVVRTEALETTYQQEEIPRYLKGQSKGAIRLAAAEQNVNSNCL